MKRMRRQKWIEKANEWVKKKEIRMELNKKHRPPENETTVLRETVCNPYCVQCTMCALSKNIRDKTYDTPLRWFEIFKQKRIIDNILNWCFELICDPLTKPQNSNKNHLNHKKSASLWVIYFKLLNKTPNQNNAKELMIFTPLRDSVSFSNCEILCANV